MCVFVCVFVCVCVCLCVFLCVCVYVSGVVGEYTTLSLLEYEYVLSNTLLFFHPQSPGDPTNLPFQLMAVSQTLSQPLQRTCALHGSTHNSSKPCGPQCCLAPIDVELRKVLTDEALRVATVEVRMLPDSAADRVIRPLV